jgi:homoserine O-succinyltransferase
MPICFGGDSSGHPLLESLPVSFRGSSANCLNIGLVNNMPDKALLSTERQFLTLLDSAAHDVVVRLWLYALPDIPRTEWGQRHIGNFYSGIEHLFDRRFDGLIVTGAEPQAPNLRDEPYWASLTKVIDWAEQNTYSTIWSCLAAHAALLHTDGIGRRRLPEKCFGLFECERVAEHALTAGISRRFVTPHSRWNDISEDELTACGYSLLARAEDAGADAFVKQSKSLFVFFQGHPEYEANTLLLEYIRDVGRYLRHESDNYPPIPRGYFDSGTVDALAVVQERALCDRREELLVDFPSALTPKNLAQTWRPPALLLYSNWLGYLCAQKERQLHAPQTRKRATRGTNSVLNRPFAAGE